MNCQERCNLDMIDNCSYAHNLSSFENKGWNGIAKAMGLNLIQALNFIFLSFNFTTAYFVVITSMIIHNLTSFSTVHRQYNFIHLNQCLLYF